MDDREFKLYDAADQAMSTFRTAYFGHDDPGEFPPSTILAGLMAHARYDGWNFEAAARIARTRGALSSTEIAEAKR